jgi:hypothetical protein
MVSSDWEIAAVDTPRPASLVIQLRREVFVLPWFRFGYAQGNNTHVVIVTGSHHVQIEGWGFASLLAGLAGHRVVRIIEPTENETKFGVRGENAAKYVGPGITKIGVSEA